MVTCGSWIQMKILHDHKLFFTHTLFSNYAELRPGKTEDQLQHANSCSKPYCI